MKDKPEYRAVTFKTPVLPDDKRELLSGILSVPKSSVAFLATVAAFEEAATTQHVLGAHSDRNQSYGELKHSLESLYRHLACAERAIDEMNGQHEWMLDQFFYLANERDAALFPDAGTGGSAFGAMVHKLRKTISFYEDQLSKPSRSDKTYTSALVVLADCMEEHFPHVSLSKNKGSSFHKVVQLWFDFLGDEKEDPWRHIQTMLKARHISHGSG